jgi:predicted nuclease with TOPRIM domain
MAELEQEHQDQESKLLAQIFDLEDRVRSYEERLDELSSTNSGLHEALRNQEARVKARVDAVQRPLDATLQHQATLTAQIATL